MTKVRNSLKCLNQLEKGRIIVTNREQRITTTVLISCIEKKRNKKINVHHFIPLVSFKLFNVKLIDDELEVKC